MSTLQEETANDTPSQNPNIAQERVLVVPTELFQSIGYFQGFTDEVEKYLPGLLESDQVTYQPRHAMEEDPNFKQLIPYMLFCHQQPNDTPCLFQYTRGGDQGETRLHAKRSVGIGGHISTLDIAAPLGKLKNKKDTITNHAGVYREGMLRELSEEILLETQYREKCVGLINDDQTSVGKVHLGVVHRFDVQSPNIRANETGIQNAGFKPIHEIFAELDQFETWSQIAVRALFED